MKKELENLIFGAGLAGIWTAFQLYKRGKSFTIIDMPGISRSSRVAAGIYNPLLPKHFKKSYNADKIYPFLGKKYHEIEEFIGKRVFNEIPVSYILESQKQQNDWISNSESDGFREYASVIPDHISKEIHAPFGYLKISNSGWVNVNELIDAFINKMKSLNLYVEESIDYSSLIVHKDIISYGNISASHLFCCQGTAISTNPLTAHIVLKPAKGEILDIIVKKSNTDKIPQNNIFMLPTDAYTLRVGSNFEWDDLSFDNTVKAREEIINKFASLYHGDYEISSQQAGVRPSSADRRPLIGPVNAYKNVFILNGLGSKGVALAPHYSEMLISYIYDLESIDQEVDVRRLR